jgi:hypothetical protein
MKREVKGMLVEFEDREAGLWWGLMATAFEDGAPVGFALQHPLIFVRNDDPDAGLEGLDLDEQRAKVQVTLAEKLEAMAANVRERVLTEADFPSEAEDAQEVAEASIVGLVGSGPSQGSANDPGASAEGEGDTCD